MAKYLADKVLPVETRGLLGGGVHVGDLSVRTNGDQRIEAGLDQDSIVGAGLADFAGLLGDERSRLAFNRYTSSSAQELGQGHGQVACQPLPQPNGRGREHALAAVVQLQQSQTFLANVQGQQGYRFVALAVAAVARAGLAVGFRGARQAIPSCSWSRNSRGP